MKGQIGLADLFRRDGLASLEGPAEDWEFAKHVIDHGGFILIQSNQLRPGREVEDLTARALLRRALITGEAIRVNVASGLEEPAFVLLRSLLEIELNLKLIVSDPSGRMARRLAAFHFLTGYRQNQTLLSRRVTREKLYEFDAFDWTLATTKKMESFFDSPAFDDVREEVRKNQNWHGKKNLEDAFASIGAVDDYLQLYSLFSPFVHGANVDFDFAEVDSAGQLSLKAPIQRDPEKTLGHLKGTLLVLLRIYEEFLRFTDFQGYPEAMSVRTGSDTESFRLYPFQALQIQVADMYGGPDGPFPGESSDLNT